MTALPIAQIDAFAERPFRGNPAAVCRLERPAPEAWMQAVAAEMALSETAFLRPLPGGWELRWFTPAVEVDLCGHATLASAHFLWESGDLAAHEPARFETRGGPLTARRRGESIEMDFPAEPPHAAPVPPDLAGAIGADPVWTGTNGRYLLLELGDEREVRALRPDFARLAAATPLGVVVTAPAAGPAAVFVSRFFAPVLGVDEDPVTGSAHCCLGPFWAERLGREGLVGFQASARGGRVEVTLAGERVRLAGRAVTVLRGTLLAPPDD